MGSGYICGVGDCAVFKVWRGISGVKLYVEDYKKRLLKERYVLKLR